jgi:hypothetical protein
VVRRRERRAQPGSAGRLNSWKEIAAYLGTSERTVQRWEHSEFLPVHRHAHEKASSVYARPEELEDWLRRREPAPRTDGPGRPPPRNRPAWFWWLVAGVTLAVAAAAWTWWAGPPTPG